MPLFWPHVFGVQFVRGRMLAHDLATIFGNRQAFFTVNETALARDESLVHGVLDPRHPHFVHGEHHVTMTTRLGGSEDVAIGVTDRCVLDELEVGVNRQVLRQGAFRATEERHVRHLSVSGHDEDVTRHFHIAHGQGSERQDERTIDGQTSDAVHVRNGGEVNVTVVGAVEHRPDECGENEEGELVTVDKFHEIHPFLVILKYGGLPILFGVAKALLPSSIIGREHGVQLLFLDAVLAGDAQAIGISERNFRFNRFFQFDFVRGGQGRERD